MNVMRAILIREFGIYEFFLPNNREFIIYFLFIGDASVCKLVKDVPIPDIQSREVYEEKKTN